MPISIWKGWPFWDKGLFGCDLWLGLTIFLQIISLGTLCYIQSYNVKFNCVTSNLTPRQERKDLANHVRENLLREKKALRVDLGELGPGPLKRTLMLVS